MNQVMGRVRKCCFLKHFEVNVRTVIEKSNYLSGKPPFGTHNKQVYCAHQICQNIYTEHHDYKKSYKEQ